MNSASPGRRCIGPFVLAMLAGCANGPDVQSLATGRSDVMGYTLNGSNLESLRQEVRRLCPKGAEVLRQSSQGTQLPAPAETRWRRAFQTTAQFLDPPPSAAQMVILCRDVGDRLQLAHVPEKTATERAPAPKAAQAAAQTPLPANAPSVETPPAAKADTAAPSEPDQGQKPQAGQAPAAKAASELPTKSEPATKPPRVAENATAKPALPTSAKPGQAAAPQTTVAKGEQPGAAKTPAPAQPAASKPEPVLAPKADQAVAAKVPQAAADKPAQAPDPKQEQAPISKAPPAQPTKAAKRPELSVALPVGPVMPEW
jgi:hypothetical protein